MEAKPSIHVLLDHGAHFQSRCVDLFPDNSFFPLANCNCAVPVSWHTLCEKVILFNVPLLLNQEILNLGKRNSRAFAFELFQNSLGFP